MKDVYVLFSDGMVIAVVNEKRYDLIENAIQNDVINRLDGDEEIKVQMNDFDNYTVTFLDNSEILCSETYELIEATFYK